MELTEFLVWSRQARVSLANAVKAAGRQHISVWWSTLADDPELNAFTRRRNLALKQVKPASHRELVRMEIDEVPHVAAYFAFTEDPYGGQPVFPRCQKHYARVRELLDDVQERLPAGS